MSDTTDRMQDAARAIAAHLPPDTGFVLLAFDFKPGGRMDYCSNGKREDVVHALREMADKLTEENYAKHLNAGNEFEITRPLVDMKLWAWVGEDERGSGEVGLKQGIVPAGCIPLVACKDGKINRGNVRVQMLEQARRYRKVISLVRFGFEQVEDQVS
jgi:hypothetical protein